MVVNYFSIKHECFVNNEEFADGQRLPINLTRFYTALDRKRTYFTQTDQPDVHPDAPDAISTPYHLVLDAILQSLTSRCEVPRKDRTVLFSQLDGQRRAKYKFVAILLMLATADPHGHAQLDHQRPNRPV